MTSLGHQLQIAEHSPTAPAVVKRALRLQGIPEIRGRVPKQSDHNCPSLLACQPDHHKQHTDRGQSCDQHQRYGDHEVLQGRLRKPLRHEAMRVLEPNGFDTLRRSRICPAPVSKLLTAGGLGTG